MNSKINTLNNCENIQQLKELYRKLVFLFHPDKGGNLEDMKDLNCLYERLFKTLKNTIDKETKEYKDIQYENSSDFLEFLEKIINFDGLEVEIIGSWYWIINNDLAKSLYFQLTEIGLIWSKGKQQLFYCKGMTKKDKTHYKKKTKEELKSTYGYNKITVNSRKSLT